jgi:hypothetical protein
MSEGNVLRSICASSALLALGALLPATAAAAQPTPSRLVQKGALDPVALVRDDARVEVTGDLDCTPVSAPVSVDVRLNQGAAAASGRWSGTCAGDLGGRFDLVLVTNRGSFRPGPAAGTAVYHHPTFDHAYSGAITLAGMTTHSGSNAGLAVLSGILGLVLGALVVGAATLRRPNFKDRARRRPGRHDAQGG